MTADIRTCSEVAADLRLHISRGEALCRLLCGNPHADPDTLRVATEMLTESWRRVGALQGELVDLISPMRSSSHDHQS